MEAQGLIIKKALLSPEIEYLHVLYRVFEDLCRETEQTTKEEIYGNTLGGKIYSDVAANVHRCLYRLSHELSEELPEGILLIPGYAGGGAGVRLPSGEVFQVAPSSRPDRYFLPSSWELYFVPINSDNQIIPGSPDFIGVDNIKKRNPWCKEFIGWDELKRLGLKSISHAKFDSIRPFHSESEAIYAWNGYLYEQDAWKIIEEYDKSVISPANKALLVKAREELVQLYSQRKEQIDEALKHYSDILQRRLGSLVEAFQEKLQVSLPSILKVNHIHQSGVDIDDQEVSYFLPAINILIAVPKAKVSFFGKVLFGFPNFKRSRNLTDKEYLYHAGLAGKWKILDFVSDLTKKQIMYGFQS